MKHFLICYVLDNKDCQIVINARSVDHAISYLQLHYPGIHFTWYQLIRVHTIRYPKQKKVRL